MRYRRLGSSDLEVSEISLGSWLTFAGGVEFEQTRACTEAAFKAGINFFDTANVYGRGAAEEAWGEIISNRPRDSYVLATKVYFPMSSEDRGLSAPQIRKQIDASLGRLRTDYVDLYQAHRFDNSVPIEETIEALQQVVESGKARYLGFSEWTPEQIQAAIDIAGPALHIKALYAGSFCAAAISAQKGLPGSEHEKGPVGNPPVPAIEYLAGYDSSCWRFFAHRASAAFLAIADRSSFVSFAARAFPPFKPPSLPSS